MSDETLTAMSQNKTGNVNNVILKLECLQCNSVYSTNSNLRRHVKKFHPDKQTQLAPSRYKTAANFKFSCVICMKNFNQEKHRRHHMKTCHGAETISGTSTKESKLKKCPLCNYQDSFKINLITHFEQVHDVVIQRQDIEIVNSDFRQWKTDLECSTNTRFTQEYVQKSKNMITENYVCHRSGPYLPRGKGLRHLKRQGSNKINAFCPAGFKVRREKLSDKCHLQLIETHVGHKNDIGHLCLTELERKAVAQKIAAKVPFDSILDDIRDSVSNSTLQRVQLLTKKDLYNIKSSFNLCSSTVRHSSNDAISVEAWIKEVQENSATDCVLFYKPQNTTVEEHPELKSEDFVDKSTLAIGEEKNKLKNYFNKLVDNVTSPSQLAIIKKMVAPISPILAAASSNSELPEVIGNNFPHNRKIEVQRRLFSTKMKTPQIKKLLQKPHADESNKIAASLVFSGKLLNKET